MSYFAARLFQTMDLWVPGEAPVTCVEMAVTNWDCVESTDWVGRRHLRNVCRMMRFEGVRSCKAELVARHPDL